ncbi:HEAT repeat protein [Thalassoglobus neptunius]|uniref:HEAT repeat protein n=1 Tax=Thalassoglobus neptunius TaxID=1938619 RepID=A0A5C5VT63_9PLAN|nr:PVC-type heme-binding CxxCH protein [Thalassoglobus neptunius]TWT40732.1 HEAT repeat protein [Thalassoglobus neptunius]
MSKHRVTLAVLFSVVGVFSLQIFAQESTYSPEVQGPSTEGELALEGFVYPSELEVKLWAAEPMLANPVAFGIDETGGLYICETFRQQKGVEDNRSHMNWLADDLSLTSVDERLEMFRKFLGADVEKYALEHDRIRLLRDTDGDGKADTATTFADGFNSIVDGTGAGVLAIDGDVYYTCIPKLYRMRDENGDGVADEIETLHDGYGVRVAFRGHDMHGLTLGPDGRLYFSIGDRGYNVVTMEGKRLLRPDTGAVFRCELDGSDLEVFAYGLRNPQELAFDDFGNLFTGDNNSDSGDQARWVYVTQGSDTGWRMYYQYLPDRGPWNRERIWYPYQSDDATSELQPAYVVPPIANISDGPSGLVHYPGVGLSPKYDGHFFLADFRGSAGQSGVRHFRMEPKGATFELVDDDWLIKSILVTDVDFGFDGRVYLSDWVDGWNGPGKGRIYTLTDPQYRLPSLETPSEELMTEGLAKLSETRLGELLAHPDKRIRQRAQFELVKKEAEDVLREVANSSSNQKARLHAIWGLGQMLRVGKILSKDLIELANDQDPEVRAQALNVLGDNNVTDAAPLFVAAVGNGTPRQKYFAAIGLGNLQSDENLFVIVDLLKQNDNSDPVLRHAAIRALAMCATDEQLVEFSKPQFPPSVRLGAVVALRRMESGSLKEFLNDPEPMVVVEAARAIHDLDIVDAVSELAELGLTPDSPDALIRRVMSANFKRGRKKNAERVAEIAADSRFSDSIREEAMQELLQWDEPPVFDRVTNKHRPLDTRSLDLSTPAVRGNLGGMMAGNSKLKTFAIQLAAKYEVQDVASYLQETFEETGNDPEMRREALIALDAVNSMSLMKLLDSGLTDEHDQIRAASREILARRNPVDAVPVLAEALNNGSRIERQSAIHVLDQLNVPEAEEVLLKSLDELIANNVPADIKLDLIEVAEKRESIKFKNRLNAIEKQRDPNDPLSAYRECLEGGDLTRGIEIFFGNATASCRRCHKVKGDGSDVGPDLSAVSKENSREYLLESIVLPNAKIAKGFETVVYALADGRIVSGIVKGETDETVRLMQPMGEIVVIEKDDIDAQTKGQSGMPADMAKQLTKSEIRDLIEYLSTLKTPYDPKGHE